MSKFFVEIGAANFDTLLPLAKMGWKGIVVEPIPYLAEQLRDIFADYNVNIVEAAISDYNGTIQMIVANEDHWITGASHVVSSNHIGYRLSDHPDRAKDFSEGVIRVQCMTLDNLLRSIDHVDVMKVDVEGHELNVFMNYSFNVKPSVIKVEHKHVDDKILRRKLETNGYMVWTESEDLYAVSQEL